MDLRSYLDLLRDNEEPGAISAFASRCDIANDVYLHQLARRKNGRLPSPSLAVRIERESGGKVTRKDLRPDWLDLWPELEQREDPDVMGGRRKAKQGHAKAA